MTLEEQMQQAADEVVTVIRPLIGGKLPALQGLIVAELLAIYVAGYRPEMREEILELEVAIARALLPVWGERIRPRQERPDA